ncbi:MAG: glycosyltransferase [Acidimicrobiia bacterium]|nr:glycosyltransferase [Acidimicrobiia bacterium]
MTDKQVVEIRAVAIDLQPVQGFSSRHRGIGRYVLELATAMVENQRDHVHSLLIHPRRGFPPELERFIGTGLLRAHTPEPPVIDGTTPDIYLVTSPYEGDLTLEELWPRWARKRPVQTAVVLYDLIPDLFPDHYLIDPVWESKQWARTEFVKQADLILCISEATASDALTHLGVAERNVATIGTGVSGHFSSSDDPSDSLDQAANLVDGLRPGFVMYTGGIDYRKNLSGLLDAYALIPANVRAAHQLVIVCQVLPSERKIIGDQAAELGIEPDVLLTGFVPDTTLALLYQSADLFVFPSIYEGFGLPVAEAVLSGTLSIASDSSSMTNLVLDPDLRFDPHDPSDIARCLLNALDLPDAEARAALQRTHIEEFTWARVSKSVVDATAGMIPRTHTRRGRSRIAMVTPVPPAESGIADYSWRLAHALAKYVDVDVIPEDPSAQPVPVSRHLNVTHEVGLLTRDKIVGYDEVIYVMGNSSHHANAYRLMEERRGTVMIHEARFTGFIEWYGQTQGDGLDWFHEELGEEYWSIAPTHDHEEWNTFRLSAKEGYYMTGPLVDRANRLLTTSAFAAELVRLQRPDRGGDIFNIGFGYPEPARAARRDTVRWLSTFGYQHEVKATDVIVDAFALLADGYPDLKLAIVGHVSVEFLPTLTAMIANHGLADRVVVTSRIEADEYDSWLKRTDIAVQLRTGTNGEVSAAVGDSLRFGIPTVVSAVGPTAELPDSIVAKVAPGSNAATVAEAIGDLLASPKARSDLGTNAIAYIAEHSFDATARRMLDALGLGESTSV